MNDGGIAFEAEVLGWALLAVIPVAVVVRRDGIGSVRWKHETFSHRVNAERTKIKQSAVFGRTR